MYDFLHINGLPDEKIQAALKYYNRRRESDQKIKKENGVPK
jgi:uncharacterized protein (DUF433 family)